MLQVGDVAPDFTLPNEQGHPVALASFRNVHPVVLIFYPGDNTPVCTAQLCAVRDQHQAYVDAGAVVLGINPGSGESHRRFMQRHHFQFHLLVDAERAVARQYGALLGWGPLTVINRTVYVVGSDGRIAFAQRGVPNNATVLAAIRGEQQR